MPAEWLAGVMMIVIIANFIDLGQYISGQTRSQIANLGYGWNIMGNDVIIWLKAQNTLKVD